MTRTWEDNADEYAAKDNGEDWAFVLLVACCVELDAGRGVGDSQENGTTAPFLSGKVSARKFAERAGTSHSRVSRYLAAAEEAAKDDLIPDPIKLIPEDVSTTPLPDAKEHPVSDLQCS